MSMTLTFKEFVDRKDLFEREEQVDQGVSLSADQLSNMSPEEIKDYFDKNRQPTSKREYMKLHMQLKALEQEALWRKQREKQQAAQSKVSSNQAATTPDMTKQYSGLE